MESNYKGWPKDKRKRDFYPTIIQSTILTVVTDLTTQMIKISSMGSKSGKTTLRHMIAAKILQDDK